MKNMENTTLTNIERQELEFIENETGMLTYSMRPFINSTGYKTLRTSRKSALIPDSMVCVHTLFGWFKAYKSAIKANQDISFEEIVHIAQVKKLETHHKNGNQLDNRMENIEPYLTRYQHNHLNYLLTKGETPSLSSFKSDVSTVKYLTSNLFNFVGDVHISTKQDSSYLVRWLMKQRGKENVDVFSVICIQGYRHVKGYKSLETTKYLQDKIVIFLKHIHVLSTIKGENFYKNLCRTIQHEVMHRILENEHGEEVNDGWDNIYPTIRDWW